MTAGKKQFTQQWIRDKDSVPKEICTPAASISLYLRLDLQIERMPMNSEPQFRIEVWSFNNWRRADRKKYQFALAEAARVVRQQTRFAAN